MPIIKQLNEVGGLIYGILMGLIFVYVILAALYFIISVNNTGKIISRSQFESIKDKLIKVKVDCPELSKIHKKILTIGWYLYYYLLY